MEHKWAFTKKTLYDIRANGARAHRVTVFCAVRDDGMIRYIMQSSNLSAETLEGLIGLITDWASAFLETPRDQITVEPMPLVKRGVDQVAAFRDLLAEASARGADAEYTLGQKPAKDRNVT